MRWCCEDRIEEFGVLEFCRASVGYETYYDDRDGGSSETVGGNSSRQQQWCRSSTLATTAGGNGSFAASISCSDKLDDDRGERSWVWWMEEVAVTMIFVGGGKSSSGRGLVRQPYDTSSLFRLTEKDKGRDGVGYGMMFDGDSR
ncbi:unnamed protein product [Lactuca saligna]|uniref:Uncharacterized protein n=1 Tax=Lactuca saligna TaxID=75948 RepID=A0AA35YTR6_LACSI|nr:unnamed protein product [Lactuca saligna]